MILVEIIAFTLTEGSVEGRDIRMPWGCHLEEVCLLYPASAQMLPDSSAHGLKLTDLPTAGVGPCVTSDKIFSWHKPQAGTNSDIADTGPRRQASDCIQRSRTVLFSKRQVVSTLSTLTIQFPFVLILLQSLK